MYIKMIYARVSRYHILPPSLLANGGEEKSIRLHNWGTRKRERKRSLWIIIARPCARLKRDNGKIPLSRMIYVLILSCACKS